MKVFLGGTVNGSTWREDLIPRLGIDYFNPVVADWNEAAIENENREKEDCSYFLYVLSPKSDGFYTIAQVTNESYQNPDKLIFCYLPEDDGHKFNPSEIESLKRIGKATQDNGGAWLQSLDEVTELLNSRNSEIVLDQELETGLVDIFVSYGRRHSKDFATELVARLKKDGYRVWFDQEAIPLGVDFQLMIDEGIKNSNNFIFIISPHSVASVYCGKEIARAIALKKRIIPILHVDPAEVWDKMHPVVGALNWIYFDSADKFEGSYKGLKKLVNSNAEYIQVHTEILIKALDWDRSARPESLLLRGKEREKAISWLHRKVSQELASSEPTSLHCDFICETIKYTEGGITDTFLSASVADKEKREQLRLALSRHGITSWVHTGDISSGEVYANSIERGIDRADNFLFLITQDSLKSTYCIKELDYALELNKKIIPLLLAPVPVSTIPPQLGKIQYLDFTDLGFDNSEATDTKDPFDNGVGLLRTELKNDSDYLRLFSRYLDQARNWDSFERIESLLARGQALEVAENWLKVGKTRTENKPLPIQKEWIKASRDAEAGMTTDVFIAYDPVNTDIARLFNRELKKLGKVTWFDQENVWGTDLEEASIREGIEKADNVLFLLSESTFGFCKPEIELADGMHKRSIPVLVDGTSKTLLPESLQGIETVNGEGDYSRGVIEVLRLLETDKDHNRSWNIWWNRSHTWDREDRNEEKLLGENESYLMEVWLQTAKEDGKSPAPTPLMEEYLAESKKGVLAAKKRIRIRNRVIQALSVFFLIACVFAVYGMFRAIEKEKEAVRQEQIAIIEKQKAEFERDRADSSAVVARNAEATAREEEQKARVAEKEAIESREEAIVQKGLALKARDYAEKKKKEAELAQENEKEARLIAEAAEAKAVEEEEKAKIAQALAEENERKANRLKLLALAKSMALKSLQIQEPQRKGLLAYQAYNFHRNNTGPAHEPDIYDGLYESKKALLGNDFNQFKGHGKDAGVRGLAFFGDGNRVVSGGGDGRILVWDPLDPKGKYLQVHAGDQILKSTQVGPNSRWVAFAGGGKDVLFEDLSKPEKPPRRLSLHKEEVMAIGFMPDGNSLLSGDQNGLLVQWEIPSGKVLKKHNFETGIRALEASPDGSKIALLTAEGQVYLLDPNNFNSQSVLIPKSKDPVSALKFSRTGNTLACGSKFGKVKLYDLGQTDKPVSFSGAKAAITSIDFGYSSDLSQVGASSMDGNIYLWDTKDPTNLPILLGDHGEWIWKIAFSPQKNVLVSSDYKGIIKTWPIDLQGMAKGITPKLSRNFSPEEWRTYVGKDVEYELTVPNLP